MVIGNVKAFRVIQHVVGLKKEAATPAAIADGVCPFFPVGDGMNQSGVSGLFQYLFGLLSCYLTAEIILDDVMAELAKVEADF